MSNSGFDPPVGDGFTTTDEAQLATNTANIAANAVTETTDIATVNATIAAGALQKRSLRIQAGAGPAQLTDAVNGEAQVINVGAVLPANAVVLASEVQLDAQFTGGGATSVKLALGGTDALALANAFDVFGSTAGKSYTPGYEHATIHGTHMTGKFGGQQLVATFTPDVGHNLAALTAGDLTITVWFMVLA